MPGIHPSSRQQVRWAFAAESRGQFPKGKAREWAHNWKCWTKVPLPPGCGPAMKILSDVRRQHPTWKVPGPVLEAEQLRKKVVPLPERARPAARVAGVVYVPIMRVKRRPATVPIAAYIAKLKKQKLPKPKGLGARAKARIMREDTSGAALSRLYSLVDELSRGAGKKTKKKTRRAA